VDEHVEADLLLPAHGAGCLLAQELLIRTSPITPLSWSARALRTSGVCGKDPMVVVG
jgi:hypothetical protein